MVKLRCCRVLKAVTVKYESSDAYVQGRNRDINTINSTVPHLQCDGGSSPVLV